MVGQELLRYAALAAPIPYLRRHAQQADVVLEQLVVVPHHADAARALHHPLLGTPVHPLAQHDLSTLLGTLVHHLLSST